MPDLISTFTFNLSEMDHFEKQKMMSLDDDNLLFMSEEGMLNDRTKILLLHTGSIDQYVVKMLATDLELKLKTVEEHVKTFKRVYFISVEIIQNVSKYSDDAIKGKGAVSVKKNGNTYFMSSVNVINNAKVTILKNNIEILNNLSLLELDNLYDKILLTTEISDKGGANLGFIEMIRKSKQKIRYSFEKINDTISNFYITVVLKKEEV